MLCYCFCFLKLFGISWSQLLLQISHQCFDRISSLLLHLLFISFSCTSGCQVVESCLRCSNSNVFSYVDLCLYAVFTESWKSSSINALYLDFLCLGTPSPTKFPCPPGTFTNRSDLYMESQCTDCYQQWYCPGGEAAPRDRCPPGYYCPIKTRFATEYPCPNRTYNPDYGLFDASQCKVCTQGHFCEKGTVTPYECQIGKLLSQYIIIFVFFI